ncbi:MAG: dihydroorotase family protein [archaeon]|nr:dihydroorotase family protein [archaeon]
MEEIVNIVNAKVWLRRKIIEAGISIVGDRIAKIGNDSTLLKAEKVFDAGGRLVLPGFIDVHTHLRDFELSYKEDFSSGTAAAVAGGFTLVLDMPNNKPPTTTPEMVKARIQKAEEKLYCDVGFYATPKSPYQVNDLVNSGCIAMKIYMTRSLNGEKYSTEKEIYDLMKETSSLGIMLSAHAEDPKMIRKVRDAPSPNLHAKAHSIKAEESAIDMAINATRKSHGRLNVCHVSTLGGLSKIKRAKREGIDVTCEVTPHHAILTNKVFEEFGRIAIVEPPLRSKKHIEAILRGISNGDVDILATDHAPHTLEEKEKAHPGFPGLEIALPVFFTLVRDGLLPLNRVVDAFTIKPAERFSLTYTGELDVGGMANFTIIDLKRERTINQYDFLSKAKFSPFNGMVVKAGVHATFVRGKEVFLNGEIVSPAGVGRVIHGKIRS